MSIDDIVMKIILMPRMHHESRTLSMVDLIKQSGYYSEYDNVTEDLIRQKLSQFPKCVDEWMTYTEGMRGSGFYFVETENVWDVGYLGAKYDFPPKHYTKKVDACTWLIKHFIEDIRATFPL